MRGVRARRVCAPILQRVYMMMMSRAPRTAHRTALYIIILYANTVHRTVTRCSAPF